MGELTPSNRGYNCEVCSSPLIVDMQGGGDVNCNTCGSVYGQTIHAQTPDEIVTIPGSILAGGIMVGAVAGAILTTVISGSFVDAIGGDPETSKLRKAKAAQNVIMGTVVSGFVGLLTVLALRRVGTTS